MKKSELTQGEFGEFYSGYIKRINDDAELITAMKANTEELLEYFKTIPQDKWNYKYQPGKWSLLEMIQHIIDTERIFQYRALCIARNELKSLPGYDHDLYVLNSGGEHREISDLIEEFNVVRQSGLYLFKSFSEEMLKITGNMNDANTSPRAIGFILLGHALHHKDIIQNRYL